MAIDDHPITALRTQLDLEATSTTQFVNVLLNVVTKLPLVPPALKLALDGLKVYIEADSGHRMEIMLQTCADEVVRLSGQVDTLSESVNNLKAAPPASPDLEEYKRQAEIAAGLVFDAARKASVTRDEERVKRIGMILAHGLPAKSTDDADDLEEMMRIAMELSDRDVAYLAKLVKLEGEMVRTGGRIARYEAHQRWENSELGGKPDPDVESAFSKLSSYGLVWRLPPQNNLNVIADIQNGYALLPKGLRFIDLITSRMKAI
jgi:hypothetical protein